MAVPINFLEVGWGPENTKTLTENINTIHTLSLSMHIHIHINTLTVSFHTSTGINFLNTTHNTVPHYNITQHHTPAHHITPCCTTPLDAAG